MDSKNKILKSIENDTHKRIVREVINYSKIVPMHEVFHSLQSFGFGKIMEGITEVYAEEYGEKSSTTYYPKEIEMLSKYRLEQSKENLKAMAQEKINKDKIVKLEDINNLKKQKTKITKTKFDYERRIIEIDRILKASYEDKINGILTTEEFVNMSNEYRKEKESLVLKIETLEKQVDSYEDNKKQVILEFI